VGKVAFVFAGQGAQTPGMGRDLYQTSAAARGVFDQLGADWPEVTSLCFDGPAEALNQTINTQPALFAVDLACARALAEAGVEADGVAGFSLGEIPAVCWAGLMDEGQAFRFVRARAAAMQAASLKHPGAMLAVIGLTDEAVADIAAGLGDVYPVNYNCPGQVAVACPPKRTADVREAVAAAGGKAVPLKVSGAFHSPLMDEAARSLRDYVADLTFGAMRIPVYANATGGVYDDPRGLLAGQVNHPVLWRRTIENMIADGFDRFVELGPGKTLASFIARTNPHVTVAGVRDAASLAETKALLCHDR